MREATSVLNLLRPLYCLKFDIVDFLVAAWYTRIQGLRSAHIARLSQ